MNPVRTDSEPIRVIIADDHTLFREGVASLLERVSDIALIGEAATGEEALQIADELLPDIILMDLNMPGLSGIDATRRVVERNPHIGVIVLTMFEDDESVFAALKAGARGYVLKDADRGLLLQAIRAVAAGQALLGPSIARRVVQEFARSEHQVREDKRAESNSSSAAVVFAELTPRELEVLGLIANGLRNRDIAELLCISEKTVGNHISNIFSKLHVADRSQAILLALRHGMISPSTDL